MALNYKVASSAQPLKKDVRAMVRMPRHKSMGELSLKQIESPGIHANAPSAVCDVVAA